MKILKVSILTVAVLLLSVSAFSQIVDSAFVDGAVYAKLHDTSTAHLDLVSPPLSGLVATYGLDTMYWPFRGVNNIKLDKTYVLQFSDSNEVDQLIADLEALPMIDYAEKVPLNRTDAFVPNDIHPQQYYLDKINAQAAWDISTGSPDVVIAIVDNGVRLTHNDLEANIWVNPNEILNGLDDDDNLPNNVLLTDDINGFDLADFDNNPFPPASFDHGTHCAGIAAAVTNNGSGIASIGFNVEIMAVKVAPDAGDGNQLTASYQGVIYAILKNADVISMSWGSSQSSRTDKEVIDEAFNRGIVLVAAAGNDNSSAPFFPAAYPNVISVGSTNENDQKSSFSNFGSTVDVMAPGSSILSAVASADNAFNFLSGTSMACPLVAGLAALAKSAQPGLTPTEVRNALTSGCDNISSLNPGFNGQLGAGRINAFKTLSLVTGVSQVELGQDILLYPNPVAQDLHIRLHRDETLDIRVFDLLGVEVYAGTHSGKKFSLQLGSLKGGVYIVEVQTNSGKWQGKIVKAE